MRLELVFNKSGDAIEFDDVLLPGLTEYYINYLDEHDVNEFTWVRSKSSHRHLNRELLRSNFHDINQFLNEEYGITVFNKFDIGEKYFDQDQLNEIHREWVKLNSDENLSIVHNLSCKSADMYNKYQTLNAGTHLAEKGWEILLRNKMFLPPNFVMAPRNVYDQEQVTSFDVANLCIAYGGLGRQTYNKWECDDEVVNEIDTKNFEELYGVIRVNLGKPHTVSPPADYLEFCKRHKVAPLGTRINLANINNYKSKLIENRTVMYRNTTEDESSASLRIK